MDRAGQCGKAAQRLLGYDPYKNKVSVNLLTDTDVEIYEENNGIIMVIHVPKAKGSRSRYI